MPSVHQLKVTLRQVRPEVWRRLLVPSGASLAELGDLLLAAFDRQGPLPHRFALDDVPVEDGVALGLVADRPGAALDYLLGEQWRHRIVVEAVFPADPSDPGQAYPACLDGRGLAPDERTGQTRFGRFDRAALEQLNLALRRRQPESVPDREEPTSDPAFTGLFPGFTAQTPSPLRPYRPVPDRELAALVTESALVGQALALARWAGQGRPLTPGRALLPGDADVAADKLGLALPEVHALWSAAAYADLVDVRGAQAVPGAGLELWLGPGSAEQRLESWARLLAGFLRARTGKKPAFAPITEDELLPVSAQLFYTLARDPIPAAMPALLLASSTDDANPLESIGQFSALPAAMVAIALDWIRAGVLTLVHDSPHHQPDGRTDPVTAMLEELLTGAPDAGTQAQLQPMLRAVRESPIVQLTPLGAYGLRRLLIAHGWPVPEVGVCADLAPELLLDELDAYMPEDVIAEAEVWLERHGEAWQSALNDVTQSARTKDLRQGPTRRAALSLVMQAAGPRVAPVLDELSTDPWLAAVAAGTRHGLALGPEPTLAEQLWLAIDDLCVILETDAAERADVLRDSEIFELLSRPGGVQAATSSGHPYAHETLYLVSELAADAEVAERVGQALDTGPADRPGRGRRRK